MFKKKGFVVLLLAGLATVFALGFYGATAEAAEQTAEQRGLAITVKADERDSGWLSLTADLEMELKNRHGDVSLRQMRLSSLEVSGDGDKSINVILNPRDVKGTSVLSWSHKVGDDDQWLYLPALKRVKRISSSNKSGSFMGSEFSYEDMTSREVEKYDYKLLQEEPCKVGDEQLNCFVVQSIPNFENSGYTKIVAWIDDKEYRTVLVKFYDRKQAHLKTLDFIDYKKYGKFWRADEMYIVNHQSGKSTRLKFKNYNFAVGLSDSDFNQNALKRAR